MAASYVTWDPSKMSTLSVYTLYCDDTLGQSLANRAPWALNSLASRSLVLVSHHATILLFVAVHQHGDAGNHFV